MSAYWIEVPAGQCKSEGGKTYLRTAWLSQRGRGSASYELAKEYAVVGMKALHKYLLDDGLIVPGQVEVRGLSDVITRPHAPKPEPTPERKPRKRRLSKQEDGSYLLEELGA